MKDYELLIIGDGPERKQMEDLCGGHPDQYAIRFCGVMPRNDVLKELRGSRLLVVPSICYEGFPMTIVEAFASGAPVLSAKLGGMVSIIDENDTGLFFEPGDSEMLSSGIQWAIAHELEMEAMGRRARACYEEKYAEDLNSRQLLELYNRLLD